jgi:hypothetical protein
MSELAANQIRFAIHGPDVDTDAVSASVFAAKLSSLVSALKAADAAVNGTQIHDYVIDRLHTSTPTAILSERTIDKQLTYMPERSGIDGFCSCADAITNGDRQRATAFGACASRIERLARGARGKSFGYAEVCARDDKSIRVDDFLKKRASTMIRPVQTLDAEDKGRQWFNGTAHGTFDGEVKAVDLRGSQPELKLILSAGGKEIDCVFRSAHIPEIGRALNRRVRLSGRAIYDSRFPLPIRLEVSDIKIIDDLGDFLKWRGAFRPFETEGWEEDEA